MWQQLSKSLPVCRPWALSSGLEDRFRALQALILTLDAARAQQPGSPGAISPSEMPLSLARLRREQWLAVSPQLPLPGDIRPAQLTASQPAFPSHRTTTPSGLRPLTSLRAAAAAQPVVQTQHAPSRAFAEAALQPEPAYRPGTWTAWPAEAAQPAAAAPASVPEHHFVQGTVYKITHPKDGGSQPGYKVLKASSPPASLRSVARCAGTSHPLAVCR